MAEEVTSLFLRARRLSPEERARFLSQACEARPELRREVESLLEHDLAGARWMPDHEPRRSLGAVAPLVLDEGAPEPGGWHLGRYPILGVLGRGGMGVVYRSQQASPRRPVALKVLRAELLHSEGLKRFQQEVEILGRLRHPGLAQVYEAGTCETALGELPFLAMELVEGQPLLEHCAALDLEQKLERIAAIADAVDHAHRHGVVHRDLKPSNVLVDPSGQVKVIDFGIARDVQGSTTLTLSGQLVGTLPYMSPEQLSGQEEIDARTDVYALGVCLHQVLTGELPHALEGRSLEEALRILQRGLPARPAALAAVGRDLETIVLTALAAERTRRYASAAELAQDLRRFLRREPILARPASSLYRLRRSMARHRAALIVTGALAFALLSLWTGRRALGAQTSQLRVAEAAQELQSLRERATGLWPHAPGRPSALEGWIREGEALAAQLPELERALAELRGGARATAAGWTLAAESDQRAHDRLARLVLDLTAFADPDPTRGLLSQIREHASYVERRIGELTGEHEAEWMACLDAIERNPRYGGLRFDPQDGLVPLREDPGSGLWEFWHSPSGSRPEVEPGTDRWRIRPETGLVFVLLPAGTFRMGAQNLDPSQPNWDLNCLPDTMPVHEVSLSSFFLSKYELTQAQWERLTGSNPSRWKHGGTPGFGVHPVDGVTSGEFWPLSWYQWGLRLPTEAQWEYAARAGTTMEWFLGVRNDSLEPYANLKDQSYRREIDHDDVFVPWDDTFPDHAPVGSFEPNPFGLFDMFGNVLEWCGGDYGSYELPVEPESGARVVPEPLRTSEQILRGGSYQSNSAGVTPSVRVHLPGDTRMPTIGIRPMRWIEGL